MYFRDREVWSIQTSRGHVKHPFSHSISYGYYRISTWHDQLGQPLAKRHVYFCWWSFNMCSLEQHFKNQWKELLGSHYLGIAWPNRIKSFPAVNSKMICIPKFSYTYMYIIIINLFNYISHSMLSLDNLRCQIE